MVLPRTLSSIRWVNTPVLLEAITRYEEDRLPRSMRLWLMTLLEIDEGSSDPLRPGC